MQLFRSRLPESTKLVPPNSPDTPPGMMSTEQLERPNETAINGKSSLMHLAGHFSKSIEAAERQHAQSLQEVIDAQTDGMSKFTIRYGAAMEKFRMAAEMATTAQRELEAAVKEHIEDAIDTSQMVALLRDIRIKSPLKDKVVANTKAANLPRKKRG